MSLREFKVRLLKWLFSISLFTLFFLAIYNVHIHLYILAYIEFFICALLIIGIFYIEKHYRIVIASIVFFSGILMAAVIYTQIFLGRWDLAVWLPVYVLAIFMLTNHWGGLLSSVYVILLTLVAVVFKGILYRLDVIFYIIQLVFSLVFTSLFYFAFYEMWKRYEEVLKKQAETDYLTGVFSRGKIFHLIEKEMERARRLGSTFSIIMIDLDDFKKVNDEKGHLFGDRVLKEVAKTIKKTIKKNRLLWKIRGRRVPCGASRN